MVTRKPLPAGSPLAHGALPKQPLANPRPTVASPTVEPAESDNEWDQSDPDWDDDEEEDPPEPRAPQLPASLRVGGSSQGSSRPTSRSDLPSSLKPGPSGPINIRKSQESLGLSAPLAAHSMQSLTSGVSSLSTSPEPPKIQSYNPFLKPQRTGDQLFGTDKAWAGEPSNYGHSESQMAPAQRPTFSQSSSRKSSAGVASANPIDAPLSPYSAQPPLIPVESEFGPPHPEHQDPNDPDPWKSYFPPSQNSVPQPHLQDANAQAGGQGWIQEQDWIDNNRIQPTQYQTPSEQHIPDDGWRSEAYTAPNQQSPALPPKIPDTGMTAQQPPSQPTLSETAPAPMAESGSPSKSAQKQRGEFYQIKQVRWHDSYTKKLRISPVLIQNANGPCPLLALVNALVLSTPVHEDTALVEALRTREQVSLGLLLDAVFDELMSGRRGSSASELPDVSELYAFLLTLHTGMNVNPRFVFTSNRASGNFHPAYREHSQPGSFEETKEMRLYSTFNIPLMHGWLPTRDSPEYAAFDRSAKNYDDALNIQFHAEELEHKLDTTGLTQEEQNLFEDLHTIKEFLSTWPTQLTDHGLKVLSQHLSPGQFAILFRNDHFSTIYKEPTSQQLLTLVTDAGYSSHEEIVWESLVDVNGAETEHFSGDFRPVSHNIFGSEPGPAGPRESSLLSPGVQSALDAEQGWTTVQGKRSRQDMGPPDASNESNSTRQGMSREEQEDADLALALQLQEEEEERQRNEAVARRRQEELSSQFIEQDARSPRPVNRGPAPNTNRNNVRPPPVENRPFIPPRRSNLQSSPSDIPGISTAIRPPVRQAGPVVRPTPPMTVRRNDDGEPPPPTYEQAAKGRPFHPPVDHPASPLAPVPGESGPSGSVPPAPGRQRSAYMSNSTGLQPGDANRGGLSSSTRTSPQIEQTPFGPRRRNTLPSQVGGPGDDREKCVVM